eukprot:1184587-Prorocentrum_minimum.AAC.1
MYIKGIHKGIHVCSAHLHVVADAVHELRPGDAAVAVPVHEGVQVQDAGEGGAGHHCPQQLAQLFHLQRAAAVMSHSVTQVSRSVTQCHTSVTQCHTVSRSVTQCHAVSHSVTQCHAVSHSVTQCHT